MENVYSLAKYVSLAKVTYELNYPQSEEYSELYASTARGYDSLTGLSPLVIDWYLYFRKEDESIVLAFARFGFVLTNNLLTGFLADDWQGDKNKLLAYGDEFNIKIEDFILALSNAYEWLAENDKLRYCGITDEDEDEEYDDDEEEEDE